MNKELPKWLTELDNEKLIKRMTDASFNFQISCINSKPNYREQEKVIMYENEILRRLNIKIHIKER